MDQRPSRAAAGDCEIAGWVHLARWSTLHLPPRLHEGHAIPDVRGFWLPDGDPPTVLEAALGLAMASLRGRRALLNAVGQMAPHVGLLLAPAAQIVVVQSLTPLLTAVFGAALPTRRCGCVNGLGWPWARAVSDWLWGGLRSKAHPDSRA
jgi:hypothetical protein